MTQRFLHLGSMGIGAGLMYFLDPVWGKRRHALLRDQVVSFFHQIDDVVGPLSCDVRNRARGLWPTRRRGCDRRKR
jgi:hypothetical protein